MPVFLAMRTYCFIVLFRITAVGVSGWNVSFCEVLSNANK
jgi:hypothetical protein